MDKMRVRSHADSFAPFGQGNDGQAAGFGRGARANRTRLRQGLDHEARLARSRRGYRGHLDRLVRPRHRARHRRVAAWAGSSRSTAPKARARRRWRCTSSPRRRSGGGTCAFIDAEHALDPAYASKLGVNIDDLLISQPDAGEQALEIADTLVRSGAIDVLVIDSVAALVPRAELEGEMGDGHVGLQARLMSQAMRKLTGSISRSRAMVIFINQIRMKIGVMFGTPETTTGGNALKFYASVRLDIRRIGAIKERDQVIGNQTRVKVVKNKMAPPFKVGRFRHHVRRGHLEARRTDRSRRPGQRRRKSGSWFSYDGQRIGQGRENAKTYLRDHAEIGDAIERAIRENAGLVADAMMTSPSEARGRGITPGMLEAQPSAAPLRSEARLKPKPASRYLVGSRPYRVRPNSARAADRRKQGALGHAA